MVDSDSNRPKSDRTPTIRIAEADAEIAACWPVMNLLRPHRAEADFVARVRLQERGGYRLAYVSQAGRPVAVAGFRIGENLAWGRFLYVDDLVTDPSERSAGHGAALMRWLTQYAREAGCDALHLDSGTHREQAHRFYRREGLEVTSYHFSAEVKSAGEVKAGEE